MEHNLFYKIKVIYLGRLRIFVDKSLTQNLYWFQPIFAAAFCRYYGSLMDLLKERNKLQVSQIDDM